MGRDQLSPGLCSDFSLSISFPLLLHPCPHQLASLPPLPLLRPPLSTASRKRMPQLPWLRPDTITSSPAKAWLEGF